MCALAYCDCVHNIQTSNFLFLFYSQDATADEEDISGDFEDEGDYAE